MQQRKGAVYGHRDLGAVQPQQAAQHPIPTGHPPEGGGGWLRLAPPAGPRTLAFPSPFLGYLGVIWGGSCERLYLLPSGGKATFVLLSDSVILSTGKEQRLLFSLEPIRAQLPKAGIETALPLGSGGSGILLLCAIQGSCLGPGYRKRDVCPSSLPTEDLFMG